MAHAGLCNLNGELHDDHCIELDMRSSGKIKEKICFYFSEISVLLISRMICESLFFTDDLLRAYNMNIKIL